jgi:AraC family transcriptional regulator, regulatory protein of adaptative response / methylated-DNA-[protein]-cysteine methyltransferase
MTSDYERIERALRFLDDNATRQPSLAEVARSVHLSEFHFQRLFRRWAGVSPKRFLQFLTVEHAKRLLEERRGVLETAYQAGLSGPSRLHDLFVTLEGVTPGDWKSRGAGMRIRYGVHDTPFGPALVAATPRGVCAIRFVAGGAEDEIDRLAAEWPGAELVCDVAATAGLAREAFRRESGAALPLYVRGTNFQLQVWKALLSVPEGAVVSYEELAERIGRPTAVRAVAGAVAANPVAYLILIPCHRVIRKLGAFGDYRWGAARKRAILGWEAAQREPKAMAG